VSLAHIADRIPFPTLLSRGRPFPFLVGETNLVGACRLPGPHLGGCQLSFFALRARGFRSVVIAGIISFSIRITHCCVAPLSCAVMLLLLIVEPQILDRRQAPSEGSLRCVSGRCELRIDIRTPFKNGPPGVVWLCLVFMAEISLACSESSRLHIGSRISALPFHQAGIPPHGLWSVGTCCFFCFLGDSGGECWFRSSFAVSIASLF